MVYGSYSQVIEPVTLVLFSPCSTQRFSLLNLAVAYGSYGFVPDTGLGIPNGIQPSRAMEARLPALRGHCFSLGRISELIVQSRMQSTFAKLSMRFCMVSLKHESAVSCWHAGRGLSGLSFSSISSIILEVRQERPSVSGYHLVLSVYLFLWAIQKATRFNLGLDSPKLRKLSTAKPHLHL